MTTQEIREAAAYLVERHGWHQSSLWSPHAGLSLFGAIAHVASGNRNDSVSPLGTKVFKELARELNVENLWVWHESPVRTKNDVLKALRGLK